MKFCPMCGNILIPKKENSKIILKCTCGFKEKNNSNLRITEKSNKIIQKIKLKDNDFDCRMKCKEVCEECGNHECYFEIKQMLPMDEASTLFFECIKCGHTWKDDN